MKSSHYYDTYPTLPLSPFCCMSDPINHVMPPAIANAYPWLVVVITVRRPEQIGLAVVIREVKKPVTLNGTHRLLYRCVAP